MLDSIIPAAGWLLVEPIEKNKTRAGLELPAGSEGRPMEAKVIAVGFPWVKDGVQLGLVEDTKLVGSTVFHKEYADHEIDVEGKKYSFVYFENVMGFYDAKA